MLSENYDIQNENGRLILTNTKKIKPRFSGTAIDLRGNLPYSPEIENRHIRNTTTDKNENFLLQSADSYVNKNLGRNIDISEKNFPISSLRRQYVIGKIYDIAASKNPEYENAIVNEYKKKFNNITDYNSLVRDSYKKAAEETKAQFTDIPLRFQFHNGDLNYHNSSEMLRDIRLHGNMTVYKGGDRHEYLYHIDPNTGINENEMFRAVHDAYGHGLVGNPFGPKGEEIAYHLHSQMYSPLAKLAVASETRGQNSNVNYTNRNLQLQKNMESLRKQYNDSISNGNIDQANQSSKALRDLGGKWKYAEQASIILPHEMLESGYNGDVPHYVRHLLKDKLSNTNPIYDVDRDHLGIVDLARFHNTGSNLLVDKQKRSKLDENNALSDLKFMASVHGFSNISKNPFERI